MSPLSGRDPEVNDTKHLAAHRLFTLHLILNQVKGGGKRLRQHATCTAKQKKNKEKKRRRERDFCLCCTCQHTSE